MVQVRGNAIRFEMGISYQWAIDAHEAMLRKIQNGKYAVCAKVQAVKCSARRVQRFTADGWQATIQRGVTLNRRTRNFVNSAPGRVRDRVAAAILGMSVAQVRALRQFALNPVPVSTQTKKRKTRSAVVDLDVPMAGANVGAKQFSDALAQIAQAVTSRSSLPILGHVILEAESGMLHLSATDLEVGVRTCIQAAVADEFRVTAPVSLLRQALKTAKREVNLKATEDNCLIVKIDNEAKTSIIGLDADEFPMLPEVSAQSIVWPQFGELVNAVAAGVSKDESRVVLTGVLIDSENIAATDTHRLFIQRHGMAVPWDAPHIIPARTCAMLEKALGCKGGDVEVGFTDQQAVFKFGNTVVVSRLIEGTFPNYSKVIPADLDYSVEIVANAEELRKAFLQVAPVAVDNSQRVIFEAKDGQVVLSAKSGSSGSTEVSVDAQVTGSWRDGVKFAISCRYALDCLAYVDADFVRLRGIDAGRQLCFDSETVDGRFAVIMPMQVS